MKPILAFLALLLLAPLAAVHAADTVARPGDRNLPINQVHPPEAFYHNHTETDPAIATTGIIAMQIHGNSSAIVRYKDIVITELAVTKRK